jgi:tetrahydromethanopterin S-methyltransferase subunit H
MAPVQSSIISLFYAYRGQDAHGTRRRDAFDTGKIAKIEKHHLHLADRRGIKMSSMFFAVNPYGSQALAALQFEPEGIRSSRKWLVIWQSQE